MIELIIMLFVALKRDIKSITITVRKKYPPCRNQDGYPQKITLL